MSTFKDSFSEEVWQSTYKHHTDNTIEDSWRRVAKALASVEKKEKQQEWEEKFYEMLKDFKAVPGGRILSNAGTEWTGTTLMNCVSGETMVHTDKGNIMAKELADKTVNVLTKDGKYSLAYWRSHGIQKLYKVTFANKHVEYVTAGHEWWVTKPSGGMKKITTMELEGNRVPLNGVKEYIYENDDQYTEGVQHGLVFGGNNFPEFTKSHDYLRGFLAGLISNDGYIHSRGLVVLRLSNHSVIKKIAELAYHLGLPIVSVQKERETPLWRITFVKKYFQLDPKLIIKEAHKTKMSLSPKSVCNTTIRVDSVEETDRIEEVYCCEEPTTHTFTLGNSMFLTGNCYVTPMPEYDMDSLEGILAVLRSQAFTLKSEGGYGINCSFIRPRGSFIHGIGVETPGAVKYMELFDKSSEIITEGSGLSASSNKNAKGKIRKGAMMVSLECNHPDIIEFITAKQTPGRLTKFNMSVSVSNAFMDKITGKDTDDNWDLWFPDTTFEKYKEEWDGDFNKWKNKNYPIKVYRTISAKWLWDLIMQSTYSRAEPGILFIDRANENNPLNYIDRIITTNPCLTGETKVAVADGRGEVTLKELADAGKDVPVFCLDDEKRVTIRMMRNPRVTGFNQPIFKVTLDDGSIIRATSNHKFMRPNGEYVEVKDLKAGTSLKVVSKFHASWQDLMPKANSRSQDYVWFQNESKTISEHKIVAEYFYNTKILSGYVVHHKDFNGLNNHPDNLQIMTREEHREYHATKMLGDNNPMRRAQTEWSDEKWQQYRDTMSAAVSGEKNGRFTGMSNDELVQHAVALTKQLDRRFSKKDWREYAEKNNLMSYFGNEFRVKAFETFGGLAQYAATLAGINPDLIDIDPRIARTYKSMNEQGYECEIIDGYVYVVKECECCGTEFKVKHSSRERSFCSFTCSNNVRTPEQIQANKDRAKEAFDRQKNERKIRQVEIYNDLKFEIGRTPLLKEWKEACKAKDVAFRIGNTSPFAAFKDLQEFAQNYNHKVVSVEEDGFEDVYNGTVDDFHNFMIGGFTTCSGKTQWITTSNCGERPLPKGSACNLGSINLTQIVNKNNEVDFAQLEKQARTLVRFLDNVNDLTNTPLPEYKEYILSRRQIGVGVMGWGSLLIMLQIPFGSPEALALREKIIQTIVYNSIDESVNIAEEKGMFPVCDPEKHASSKYFDNINLPEHIRNRIRKSGIRNGVIVSQQPTGNTGVLANIVSGGIEPVFSHEYIRTVIVNVVPEEIKDVTPKYWEKHYHETDLFKWVKEGDEDILRGVHNGIVYKIDKNRGLTKEVECMDYGVRYLKERNLWDINADYAKTVNKLTVENHLDDLKGFAQYSDAAVSKTINLPFEYSYEDFKNVYIDAYNTGYIKGITTYRSGTMTSVLSVKSEVEEPEQEEIILEDVKLDDAVTNATVTTLKFEGRKWYLTTCISEQTGQPFAIFVHTNHPEKSTTTNDAIERLVSLARNKKIPERHIDAVIKKSENDSNTSKITRVTSLLLRHGVLIKNIVYELEKVDGVFAGTFIFSLRKHLSQYIKEGEKIVGATCTNCSSTDLIFAEGCSRCVSCGHTKCG
jgi:ribonucleotide reductase alpha subunit